jgi:hypothetical protein
MSLGVLKIGSEDWPDELVWEFVEVDQLHFSPVQFVQFELVSPEIARQFIESNRRFLEMMDLSVCSSLGHRFVQNISQSKSNCQLAFHALEFPLQCKSVDGIISYLPLTCRNKVHDRDVIVVMSSRISGNSSSYHPINAIDLQNHISSLCFA